MMAQAESSSIASSCEFCPSLLVLLFGAFSSLTAAAEGGVLESAHRSYSRALNSSVLLSASIQAKNSLKFPEKNPGLALLQLVLLTLSLSALKGFYHVL